MRLLAVCLVALCLSCPAHEESGGLPSAPDYVERGDLPEITSHGTLRILLPPQQARMLPRSGDTLDFDLKLAYELAAELGLTPQLIAVEDRGALLEALLEGRGDLAIARLTATTERRRRFGFSVPLDHVREILAVRADRGAIREPQDLAGVSVAVRRSSSFYGTLRRLQEKVPELEIRELDDRLDTEEILYRVARGEYEATVADEDFLQQVTGYQPDLRAAFPLTSERPIAWAMRPDSVALKTAVDSFLHERELTRHLEEKMLGDLDQIRERKVLRVLTRNNAASYFLHRGRQMGFEFELARRFARRLGCRLQIVVPSGADQLIPWLLEGRGDIVAASLTVTPDRGQQVTFSRPYNQVSEVVVVRAGDDTITKPEGLAGRRVVVRRSSSYHESLLALRDRIDLEIVAAPEDTETEELIARVGSGEIDVTVADSNILDIELTYRDDIQAAFVLGEPKNIAWATRPADEQLAAAVNEFHALEYRGTFFNVLQRKYFKNRKRVARLARDRAVHEGGISPYDGLFRKYGLQVEIDWRLLAAQAYVESEFAPQATSWAGAIGLMQVLPRTAREMGVTGDLRAPENGVRAGALYMRHLLDLFEPTLPLAERLRFSLAAYNAGRGHVLDGRRLAREQGFNPDLWFGNVETVLPLLSKRRYAQSSRYGYCRCRQTLEYVRQIDDAYAAYIRVAASRAGPASGALAAARAASRPGEPPLPAEWQAGESWQARLEPPAITRLSR